MTKSITARPKKATSQEIIGPSNTNIVCRPALTIDWDLYGQYLEDSNLSEAEKRETIEALWDIVVSFVDLGFGIHPAQLATKDNCEQKPGLITSKSASVVNCHHTVQHEFKTNAIKRAHGNVGSLQERSSE